MTSLAMNKTLTALLGALLLTGGANAFASSVDLSVTGKITPSACTPVIAQGGVVDYGKISVRDLDADRETALPAKIAQLSVTCDATTMVGLEAKDNRLGSSTGLNTTDFGLGLINGNEKLGSMEVSLRNQLADGVSVYNIESRDGGVTWVYGRYFATDNVISVALGSGQAPVAFQTLDANLYIDSKIAPTKDLTLTNEVTIDGSVTLTVRYL